MKTLSLYDVMQRKIIADFQAIADPDNHTFDRFFVETTTVLASYGDQMQADMACLCARSLLSWNESDRENYLSSIEVPAGVLRQLSDPSPWPFQSTSGPEPEPEPE